MTFETIGIWPIRDADGTDVNAVDATDDVLAVADDNGEVLLYRYPAVHPDAEFETLMGHASHVTGVAFLQVHCNLGRTNAGQIFSHNPSRRPPWCLPAVRSPA